MRVLFNFKFRNASYLTDKCSVIRRRPFAESIVSTLSTSAPLRLWSPGLLCSLRHKSHPLVSSWPASEASWQRSNRRWNNHQCKCHYFTHTIIIIYTWNKSALIPLIPKLSELLLRSDSVLASHLWCPSPNLSRPCPLLLQCCPLWSILCRLRRPRRHSSHRGHRRPHSLHRLLWCSCLPLFWLPHQLWLLRLPLCLSSSPPLMFLMCPVGVSYTGAVLEIKFV